MKLSAFFCILLSALALQAQTMLRYQMASGEKLKYQITGATETTTNAMGQDMDIKSSIFSLMSMNVESADANQITFTSALDSIGVKLDNPAPGMTMSDSTISVLLKGITGKRTRIAMSPLGNILSTTIIDTPDIASPMLSGITKSFNRYHEMFGNLPEKAVKPGDAWTMDRNDTVDLGSSKDTSAMAKKGTLYTNTKTNYTLRRFVDTLGHHCAEIGVVYTIKSDGSMSMMGMDMTIDGDGKGKGALFIDDKKGVLVATKSRTEITQNMAMSGQENMVIPSSTTVDMNMALMP